MGEGRGVNVTGRLEQLEPESKAEEEGILSPSADATCAKPFLFEWAGRSWGCHPEVPLRIQLIFAWACTAKRPDKSLISRLRWALLTEAVVDEVGFRQAIAATSHHADLLQDAFLVVLEHYTRHSIKGSLVNAYAVHRMRRAANRP